MIGFNGTIQTPPGHDARHPDGRRAAQVHMCIQATSRKTVAEALGGRTSAYWVGMYCSKALNAKMIEALSAYPPGTLLIKADNHGTIDGETGWIQA
jgi:hypothetical protein